MKALKLLGILLILIILAAVAMGVFGPESIHVERSAEINAPVDIVFSQVVDLKKMDEWGPWRAEDPDADYTYEGEMGQVGSISKWASETIGTGQQEITKIIPNKRIESQLTFIEPFEDTANGNFDFESTESGGTKVTWVFDGTNDSFMEKMMAGLMNMDKSIGGMFEKGLESLSNAAETMAEVRKAEIAKFQINEVQLEPRFYMGNKETVKIADMQSYYENTMPQLGAMIGEHSLEMAGMPCGIYHTWEEDKGETYMAAAMPLKTMPEIEGMNVEEIGGKALHIAYYGPYESLKNAHYALNAHIESNKIEYVGPVIEEYTTDPGTESDPNKWRTDIYYLIN